MTKWEMCRYLNDNFEAILDDYISIKTEDWEWMNFNEIVDDLDLINFINAYKDYKIDYVYIDLEDRNEVQDSEIGE